MLTETLDESAYGVWAVAFGLVLLSLLAGLLGILYPRLYRTSRLSAAGARLLLVLVISILVIGGLALAGRVEGTAPRFGLSLGVVAAAVAGLHWALAPAPPEGRGRLGVALVTAGLMAAGWLTFRFVELAEPPPMPPREVDLGALVEVHDVQAYTDRGTPIQLFSRVGVGSPPDDTPALLPAPGGRLLNGRAIQVGPPDPRTICHGWTFCGGRYMIAAQAVELILQENGYRRVEVPRSGDLIIYWDRPGDGGLIVHSGVVKAVGDDGYVLVESKWGTQGRFLHEPKMQPYSPYFGYFRSERKGHLLLGLTSERPPAPTANSTPASPTGE
ncbi:MAG TPA: hypothetical protein VNK04_22040 [Gemmataceae bacterium]|nr:hypothetical protein [Gemmataceae bacterium]